MPKSGESTTSIVGAYPWVYAAFAVAVALLFQAAVVHLNYGGDWSALFFTGDARPTPELLSGRPTYRHSGTAGYDGQFYRLLAYDPLQRRTPDEAFDDASLRRRRVLTSALAWAAAGGSRVWIDVSYRAVVLAMLAVGVWFGCRLAMEAGRAPAWGLLFALAPGVLVSLERMTIDVSLAAATAAFAYGVRKKRDSFIYCALVAAPLFRETGLALTAGWCLWALLQRRWAAFGIGAATAAPFVGWAAYVASISHGTPAQFIGGLPLEGLGRRTLTLYPDPAVSLKQAAAAGMEHAAIAGVWILLLATLVWVRRDGLTALTAAAAVFIVGASLVGRPGVWSEVYAFGRVLTPLLLLATIGRPSRLTLAAWALMLPRILAQLATHALE